MLSSLLQFLEQDCSESVLIGATNHVRLLDRALFRRFDAVLEYPMPTGEIATRVMRDRLALLDTSNVDWHQAEKAADGLSHAEVTTACVQAAKNSVLGNTTVVRGAELVAELEARRRARPIWGT